MKVHICVTKRASIPLAPCIRFLWRRCLKIVNTTIPDTHERLSPERTGSNRFWLVECSSNANNFMWGEEGKEGNEIYVQKVRYICKYCIHIIKEDNNKHKYCTHLWVRKDKSSPCIILWLCVCLSADQMVGWKSNRVLYVCHTGEQAYSVHMTVQYCMNLLSQLSLFGSVCVCLLIKCWCWSVTVYIWQKNSPSGKFWSRLSYILIQVLTFPLFLFTPFM